MWWPFRENVFIPPRRIVLNHSQWADGLTPGNLKRDISINMGLFDAGMGMGYLLTVKQTNSASKVYEPHDYSIRAEYISSIGYKDGVRGEISVHFIDFNIKAKSYSIRSLFNATVESIESENFTAGSYKSTYEEFKKKWGA